MGLPFPFAGWDLDEFTYRGGRELNNEFADFTYGVNMPKDFVVWGTGDLLNPDQVPQPKYAKRLKDSFTSEAVINIAQPEELQQGLVTTQTETVTWKWTNAMDLPIMTPADLTRGSATGSNAYQKPALAYLANNWFFSNHYLDLCHPAPA
jgi:hypothetical protein